MHSGYRSEDIAAAAERAHRKFRRDMLIALVFVAAALLLTGRTGRGMKLELGPEALAVTPAGGPAVAVRYEDMLGTLLRGEIDFGTCLEGGQTDACWFGTWENGEWGRYTLCVHPKVECFAIIELMDGSRVVVNGATERETAELAEALRKLKDMRGGTAGE